VLLSFRLNPMEMISRRAGRRALVGQGAVQIRRLGREANSRQGGLPRRARRDRPPRRLIAPGAVLMPSFVNIGAYVGEGTMVDTWATVGSCAQIGRNVHISGGAGIGGVLEPLQAGPVIIEDNCFIGARSEVAEGVVVEARLGAVDGRVPRRVDQDRRPRDRRGHLWPGAGYSVVVPGALPGKDGGPALACAVIVKRVDERTRSKTSINELLRD
jgi:2,3,4,5-tetrahydropyridine-2,6-dicarboxylate N-succinyltransferase